MKKFKGVKKMTFIIEENHAASSKKAAGIIAEQVKNAPKSVLGLATGSTPIETYKELIRLHKAGELDFSQVTTFNLDEYYPIKKSNDQSYDYFMKSNLFNEINVPAENIFIPNGEAADYKAECTDYDKLLESYGGTDIQLLGIGNNGHIGFNEPDEVFTAPTHHVELDSSTIKANARFFESENEVPKHALTMGMRAIMTAKKILLIASGTGKAEIVRDSFFGPVTPKVPASLLQLHPNVTVVLDKEAAAKLPK
jgi:glucosamine-6-phosphate deaminase